MKLSPEEQMEMAFKWAVVFVVIIFAVVLLGMDHDRKVAIRKLAERVEALEGKQ